MLYNCKLFVLNMVILCNIWLLRISIITIIIIYISTNRLIGLVGRVFANGPVDLGSIPGRVIPKTLKMVLDTSLLNTQQYKVCIKGKVEKSRERSSALPDTSVYSLLKRETSGRPRLRSPTLLLLLLDRGNHLTVCKRMALKICDYSY